jgi:hypothetical protein
MKERRPNEKGIATFISKRELITFHKKERRPNEKGIATAGREACPGFVTVKKLTDTDNGHD